MLLTASSWGHRTGIYVVLFANRGDLLVRFTFYFDAGHGWLAVSETQAASVGLTEGDFSAYSYREGDTLYLEEDYDAMVFVRAWEAAHGTILTHAVDHGNWSPIRDMADVRPRTFEDEISF